MTIFLLHTFAAKKIHDLLQNKITRCDDFFLHAFTAKMKKIHDLTAKKQLPILLKMHACRQCAHLRVTSDFSPALGVGDPENAGVTKHFRPLLAPGEGKGEEATSDFVPFAGRSLRNQIFFC